MKLRKCLNWNKMAEDKRIRVSADSSPLQELRQSVEALWNDFNNMEGRFQKTAEATVDVIRQQIDLLKERNLLYNNIGEERGISAQRNIVQTDPETGRPLNSSSNLRNFDGVLNDRQLSIYERIYSAVVRIADYIEKGQRDEVNQRAEQLVSSDIQPIPQVEEDVRNSESGQSFSDFFKRFKIPTSVSALMSMLPFGAALMGIGSIYGQQAKFDAQQFGAENLFQRENNLGQHWLLNALTFGASGAESQMAEVARMAAAQNDRALSRYSSLHGISYNQALATQISGTFSYDAVNALKAKNENQKENEGAANEAGNLGLRMMASGGPMAGGIGGYGQREEAIKEVVRKREIEKSVQDEIYKVNGDISEYEAHNWASKTLGLNMTDYFDKVAEFQRAGVVSGKTSLETINQLLLANKIRGLSEQDISSVLSIARFDNSGRTGANIVQTFDTNLVGMGKDAQYIASTLGEYLQSFNRIAERVLEKDGTINSAEIMRSMTSIQRATGMEGAQLERVQNALMGVNVSQDDVSQALLLRAARQINPNGSFTDLQAMIEKMPENSELQMEFFELIKRMTGGEGEMFRLVMKSILPSLSWNDIIKLEGATGLDAEKIYKKGLSGGAAYSSEQAASMVGEAERSTAGTTNNKILTGYNEILEKIGSSIKEVLGALDKPVPVKIIAEDSKLVQGLIEQAQTNPESLIFSTFGIGRQIYEAVKEGTKEGIQEKFDNLEIQMRD